MSWQKEMLRYATPEQRATIGHLSEEIAWQTSFHDWIETRFGRGRVTDPRNGAQLVIDALKSKLRNQKTPASISDPERPATPEQLATIERLSRAIKWGTGFNKWLWRKCGLKGVELYDQAEWVIAALQDKLKAQLLTGDTGRNAEGAGPNRTHAHRP